MRLDVQSPFEWQNLNRLIRAKLGCQSNVFAYRGLHQAVFETCLGLHLRFSHKRKIVAEVGFGDHLKKTEVELAKLGVRLKDGFDDDMDKEEKGTLTYIHDLDDSLSAELYDHIGTLKKIASTKMYRIHIAHHLFHIRTAFVNKLSDYDIIICALDENYALVFAGDKIVLPQLTVSQLSWKADRDFQKISTLIDKEEPLLQQEITDFESDLPTGVKPWFEKNAKRIYDRSVVVLENHDGSAMVDLLCEELSIQKTDLGAHCALESPSFCRWSNEAWFNQAPFFSRSPDDLRGTVVIAGKIINDKFKKTFKNCLDRLEELSS